MNEELKYFYDIVAGAVFDESFDLDGTSEKDERHAKKMVKLAIELMHATAMREIADTLSKGLIYRSDSRCRSVTESLSVLADAAREM